MKPETNIAQIGEKTRALVEEISNFVISGNATADEAMSLLVALSIVAEAITRLESARKPSAE
jgi:hypothetical protein